MIAVTVTAQHTYIHGLFWGRLAFTDRITDKLRWELLLQKRTQNIPHEKNIFGADHYYNALLGFNYSFNKNLKLWVSPLSFFESYPFLTNPEDVDKPGVKEYRFSVRLDQEQKYRWLNFSNRYGVEYRLRDLAHDGDYKPNWRTRYQARLDKPIAGIFNKERAFSIFAADEVSIQFGKAVRANPNLFDQNRIFFGASYEVVKNIKASLSYLNIIQERINGKDIDVGNVVWVILTFDNLISQFRNR